MDQSDSDLVRHRRTILATGGFCAVLVAVVGAIMAYNGEPVGYFIAAFGVVFTFLGMIQLFAPADILLERPDSDFRLIAEDRHGRQPSTSERRSAERSAPWTSGLWDRELDGLP